MSAATDVVRVRAASLTPIPQATRLTLTTEDGVHITFELDDLALGLIGLTVPSMLEIAMSRPTPTIFNPSRTEGDVA